MIEDINMTNTKLTFNTFTLLTILSFVFYFPGCATTSDELPTECTLPSGVSVVSMELDEDDAGDLPATGLEGFDVSVNLNRALQSGEVAIVCYAVRDKELIAGLPIAVGFVGMTSVDGSRATREDSFNLTCVDGDVEGRTAQSGIDGMDDWDRSTGERNTKIYVQHLEGIETFIGLPTGIDGEKSNKIRVKCPR
jgi:hypothetical protein